MMMTDSQRSAATAASETASVAGSQGSEDKLVGKTIGEHYLLLQAIGHGGMGVVYKARHLMINRVVAIKMLHPHLIGVGNVVARFKQEAETISRLSHPNIVQWHDFGVTPDGTPFIVMDYVEGTLLAQVIAEQGRMPVEKLHNIFSQVCYALEHAHDAGVVHRDLKPANIMLVAQGDRDFVKVLDFGIAKLGGEGEGKNVTRTGETLGSPLYMSPEQCAGSTMDVRSDIYALGCMLYESLAGKRCVDGDNVFDIMFQHMRATPRSFVALRKDISNAAEFEELVFKCLAKDPKQRFQAMSQVKAALDEAVGTAKAGGKGTFSKRIHRLSSLVKRQKKTPILIALSCVLLVGAVYEALQIKEAWSYSPAELQKLTSFQWPKLPSDSVVPQMEKEHNELVALPIYETVRRGKGPGATETLIRTEALADYFRKTGNFPKARDLYQEVLKYKGGTGSAQDITRWRTMYHLGVCYYNLGEIDKAGQLFKQVLDTAAVFETNRLARNLAKPQSKLADVFYLRGDYKDAVKYFEEALPMLELERAKISSARRGEESFMLAGDEFDLARVFCKLADSYAHLGENQKAVDNYRKAWELYEQFELPVDKALIQYRWALALGTSPEAPAHFKAALNLFNEAKQGHGRERAMLLRDFALYRWNVQHDFLAAHPMMVEARTLFVSQKKFEEQEEEQKKLERGL